MLIVFFALRRLLVLHGPLFVRLRSFRRLFVMRIRDFRQLHVGWRLLVLRINAGADFHHAAARSGLVRADTCPIAAPACPVVACDHRFADNRAHLPTQFTRGTGQDVRSWRCEPPTFAIGADHEWVFIEHVLSRARHKRGQPKCRAGTDSGSACAA
jgi:hypothetical protein